MTCKILLGVKEDLDTFIDTFVSLPGSDFQYFTIVWKKMKFYAIFSGRRSVSEVKFLTNEILNQVKKRAVDAGSRVKERICAVFLLYSLFYIQPLKERIRIRVEWEEWEDLSFFIKTIRVDCLDVVFCFTRLWRGYGFDFVQESAQYSLESLSGREPRERERERERADTYTQPAPHSSSHYHLLVPTHIDPDWQLLQQLYNNLKIKLSSSNSKDNGLLPPVNLEIRENVEKPSCDVEIKEEEPRKKTKIMRSNRFVHSLWKDESCMDDEKDFPAEEEEEVEVRGDPVTALPSLDEDPLA